MASLIQWTWVWASSERWWRTGKPSVLQSTGFQKVEQDWTTEQQQLEYNCFTMLCYILLYNSMNQLYVYTYHLPLEPSSHPSLNQVFKTTYIFEWNISIIKKIKRFKIWKGNMKSHFSSSSEPFTCQLPSPFHTASLATREYSEALTQPKHRGF